MECGSGLSTVLLATAAEMSGRSVHSLEHDAIWAARVHNALPKRLRARVDLAVVPLRSYGEFDWYSLDGIQMPPSIGLVVCDGPPGETRGGRYGLASALRDRLGSSSVILLDDTHRPAERSIITRWCSELNASVVEEGATYTAISAAGGDSKAPFLHGPRSRLQD